MDFTLAEGKIHILKSTDAGKIFAYSAHFQDCAFLHTFLSFLIKERRYGNRNILNSYIPYRIFKTQSLWTRAA